jgi:hypothetical protein
MCSDAACCVLQVRDAYTGRADGLRCVELLPTQVGAAAMMKFRRGRNCLWYCRSERSAGCTGTDELMIVLLKARILFHSRWAPSGPVGGGGEVVRAGWLAPVLEFRRPSGELQCIKTACARYAVSVDQGVCLSV